MTNRFVTGVAVAGLCACSLDVGGLDTAQMGDVDAMATQAPSVDEAGLGDASAPIRPGTLGGSSETGAGDSGGAASSRTPVDAAVGTAPSRLDSSIDGADSQTSIDAAAASSPEAAPTVPPGAPGIFPGNPNGGGSNGGRGNGDGNGNGRGPSGHDD